jgi:hypothetical protein
MKHSEKKITICHTIFVDSCLAEEITKLNNEKDILTLSSCCGHGENIGYIIVGGIDIEKMMKLGYLIASQGYMDNEIDFDKDKLVLCSFRPKSKCECQ